MTALEQLVAGLRRGELSFEEASEALARHVETAPGTEVDAAKILHAARAAGLPHHLCVALAGAARVPGKADASARARGRSAIAHAHDARPPAATATPVETVGPYARLDRDLHEGDLLCGRFELVSKLGEGGMGAVWKGRDRLAAKTRDRNPFVAIKLLKGDFKSDPNAFLALRCETAKHQHLSHPNIATVFSFDRDDATGTVFMTMEVLDGQPLDAFIRTLPAGGLPEADAMRLIAQLCSGLSHAHRAGLVHSDLKPANAFVTRAGDIKLLDFGIARAAKSQIGTGHETPLFDPGQLGALTPAYAAMEMFEGNDPDPRDDVYALAIIAYQLLTGRHPYDRKSAPQAAALGLTPQPVAKLRARQNRGLMRGLAFRREDRAESADAFLDSIRRTKRRTGPWVGSGVAATIVIAMVAYAPLRDAVEKRAREDAIAVIQQSDPDALTRGLGQARLLGEPQLSRVLADPRVIGAAARFVARADGVHVEQGLALLAPYPQDWRGKVANVDIARRAILGDYNRRIAQKFSPPDARYDLPAALDVLARLDAIYPGSTQVAQLRRSLDDAKKTVLAALGEKYEALLRAGALIPTDGAEDVSDVLAVVSKIDSTHFLLGDRRLPFRFAEETEKAISKTKDYRRASALLDASIAYAPDDARLRALRHDLGRILTRIGNQKRIAELEQRLRAAEPRLRSLADYGSLRDELVTLSSLGSQSGVLRRILERLEISFDDELARRIAARQWRAGEDLLLHFARVLPIEAVIRQRVALSQAEQAAGFVPDIAARESQVHARADAIRALLARGELPVDWEVGLDVPGKELLALQTPGNPAFEQVRTGTARLLLDAAHDARAQGNFNKARELVTKGIELHPGLARFRDESRTIDVAERDFLAERVQERRLATIETRKAEFREKAASDDVQAAMATLHALRELGLAGDDRFVAVEAPALLARAYERLAEITADNDDFRNAFELAKQGLRLDPELETLATSMRGYAAELERR